MRRYDLKTADEKIIWQRSAEDVEDLFERGKIDLETRCRMTGLREWFELNEYFPALKYQASVPISPRRGGGEHSAHGVYLDDRGVPAKTSALIAGWICFGLGLAVAWIFPPAHFFYSVAVILAIVCMVTHQVKRGLMLLLVSCAGIGISSAIFFALALGTVANAIAPGLAELEKVRQRTEKNVTRNLQSLDRAVGQSTSTPSFRNAPVVQTPIEVGRPFDQWSAQELLSEVTRLERIQREARKAGRSVPAGTTERIRSVQAAYDRVTAMQGR